MIYIHALTVDPLIVIDAPWPDGTYSLLKARRGCPTGWSSGFVTQDLENDESSSREYVDHFFKLPFEFMLQDARLNLQIEPFGGGLDVITTYYCTKTVQGATGYKWPAGHYCIARYGGSCPDGFFEGSITWDDEDSNNKNNKHPPYPDGIYGSTNTQIFFCCRSDGSAFNEIYLPPTQPFSLYRYGNECQRVKGMHVKDHFGMIYSSNKGNADDSCSGKHPEDRWCSGDHFLSFCYYFGKGPGAYFITSPGIKFFEP